MRKRAVRSKVKSKVKVTSVSAKGSAKNESQADLEREWLTKEIRQLLDAIQEPHQQKKRTTVLRLAFAKADQKPLAEVFAQPDVCNERVWWQKWQYEPEIVEALEACVRRANEFADEETIAQEAHYRRERRIKIARHATDAPDSLADVMKAKEQRGSDRINAAMKLIGLADGSATDGGVPAGVFTPVGNTIENTVTNEGISIDIKPIDYRAIVAPLTTGPEPDRAAPGEGEGADDGPTVG